MEQMANALADAAAAGMTTMMERDPQLAKASTADVANAVMTLANRMIVVVLETSEPELLAKNREGLKQACMTMLMTCTQGEAPQG